MIVEEIFHGLVNGCAEAAVVKSACGFSLLKGTQERHLCIWRIGKKKISSFHPLPPGLGNLGNNPWDKILPSCLLSKCSQTSWLAIKFNCGKVRGEWGISQSSLVCRESRDVQVQKKKKKVNCVWDPEQTHWEQPWRVGLATHSSKTSSVPC